MGLKSFFTRRHSSSDRSTATKQSSSSVTLPDTTTFAGPVVRQVARASESVSEEFDPTLTYESHPHIPPPMLRSPKPGAVVSAVAAVYHRVLRANAGFFDAAGHLRTDVPVPRQRNSTQLECFCEPGDTRQPELDVVQSQLKRICYRLRIHDESTVGILVLLDRLVAACSVVVGPRNWRRLLLTLAVTAEKATDDVFYTSQGYAGCISGLTAQEFGKCEFTLISLLDHQILIPQESWKIYIRKLAALQAQTSPSALGLMHPIDPSPELGPATSTAVFADLDDIREALEKAKAKKN